MEVCSFFLTRFKTCTTKELHGKTEGSIMDCLVPIMMVHDGP